MKEQKKDIVIAGYAGEAGAVRISIARRALLEQRFRADYAERLFRVNDPSCGSAEALAEALSPLCPEAEEIRPAGEGGVLAAVYRMAKERKCGVRILQQEIPVRQDTIEVCELFSLNPYRLFSACAVLAVPTGRQAADRLRAAGIPAACAGYFTAGLDKVICDREETEYLNRPEPDELFKVLPDGVTERGEQHA